MSMMSGCPECASAASVWYHILTKSSETSGLQMVQMLQAAPDGSDGTQTDADKEMETDDDRGQLRLQIWWRKVLRLVLFSDLGQ